MIARERLIGAVAACPTQLIEAKPHDGGFVRRSLNGPRPVRHEVRIGASFMPAVARSTVAWPHGRRPMRDFLDRMSDAEQVMVTDGRSAHRRLP
jgi:hypothetical protein